MASPRQKLREDLKTIEQTLQTATQALTDAGAINEPRIAAIMQPLNHAMEDLRDLATLNHPDPAAIQTSFSQVHTHLESLSEEMASMANRIKLALEDSGNWLSAVRSIATERGGDKIR